MWGMAPNGYRYNTKSMWNEPHSAAQAPSFATEMGSGLFLVTEGHMKDTTLHPVLLKN